MMVERLTAEEMARQTVAQYTVIVGAAGQPGIKKVDVVSMITKQWKDKIRNGSVMIDLDVQRMVEGDIHNKDEMSRRRQDADLHLFVEVQQHLTLLGDEHPLLYETVRLEGLRKIWFHVSANDLMVMHKRKSDHAVASAVALGKNLQDVVAMTDILNANKAQVLGDLQW